MMKIVALAGLTSVYVFILLTLTEGMTLSWPHMLTVALCGAVGASLANLTRWLIERKTRRNPTP